MAPDETLVSTAERDAAARELREHVAEGRLTLEELSERLDRIYDARTRGELATARGDLPAPGPRPPATNWVVAVLGGARRTGRWRVGSRLRVVSVLGGTTLDLRQAELESADTEITCLALLGGIELLVPEGVAVDLSALPLLGGVEAETPDARPGAPVLRIRALAVLGGIEVKAQPGRSRGLPPPPLPPLLR